MNFVIGGGSGHIGRALCSKLTSTGNKVFNITRSPRSQSDISWENIKNNGLPECTNVVINLTGRSIGDVNPLLILPSKMKSYLDEVYSSRVDSTKLLAQAAGDCKSVNTFIGASAIGFYKPDLVARQTEKTKYVDHDFFTRLCKDVEASSIISNRPDIKQFQLRIGVVLYRHSPMLRQLYLPYKFGFGGPIASGKQWFSWIHRSDLVDLIEFISLNCKVLDSGPINATAPYPIRQVNFSKALSSSLGAPCNGILKTPGFVMVALLGKVRAVMVTEGQCVIPQVALDAGFHFKYPKLEDAFEEIYDNCR